MFCLHFWKGQKSGFYVKHSILYANTRTNAKWSDRNIQREREPIYARWWLHHREKPKSSVVHYKFSSNLGWLWTVYKECRKFDRCSHFFEWKFINFFYLFIQLQYLLFKVTPEAEGRATLNSPWVKNIFENEMKKKLILRVYLLIALNRYYLALTQTIHFIICVQNIWNCILSKTTPVELSTSNRRWNFNDYVEIESMLKSRLYSSARWAATS